LVGGLALAPRVEARPKLQTPALAVTHPGSTFLALSLTGSGLGTPASGSYVEAQGYVGGVLTVQPVDALSPDIVVWTDVHVVAKLPPDMTRVRARVVTPGGRSGRVWFTEGGSEPSRYDGPRNHGRVLAYDRAAQTTASTICPATATV